MPELEAAGGSLTVEIRFTERVGLLLQDPRYPATEPVGK